MWKNETRQCKKYKYLQDAITNQVLLRKVGTTHNVAGGLTRTVNRQVLVNMLNALKIELLERTHEQVSTNLIVVKSIQNELMGEHKSTPAARGVNPSTGHKIIMRDCRENWHMNIVTDC